MYLVRAFESPQCHFFMGEINISIYHELEKCQQRHKALRILLRPKQHRGTSSLSVRKLNIRPSQLHGFVSMFTLKNENSWTLKSLAKCSQQFCL